MEKIRFAFAGFRHPHIFDVLSAVRENPDLTLVACCEQDSETRKELVKSGKVEITDDNFEHMLAEKSFDVLAVGDYYSARGKLVIAALRAGKHVISDKPICISPEELENIQELALAHKRVLGLQLDLRSSGTFLAARQILDSGQIGDVQTISFSGQHPLLWGSRPGWYFERGRHGGTINDIFIHAADAIEWLTGREIAEIVSARTWNSSFSECPSFQVGAQLMLRLDNHGGVLGDVSYLAPSKSGYSISNYWRFTVHGTNGMLEWDAGGRTVTMVTHDDFQPQQIPALPAIPKAYMNDFLGQVRGQSEGISLTTRQVLRASSIAMLAQQTADRSRHNVRLTR